MRRNRKIPLREQHKRDVFIGKLLEQGMKDHNMPFGLEYYHAVERIEMKAEITYNKQQKKNEKL